MVVYATVAFLLGLLGGTCSRRTCCRSYTSTTRWRPSPSTARAPGGHGGAAWQGGWLCFGAGSAGRLGEGFRPVIWINRKGPQGHRAMTWMHVVSPAAFSSWKTSVIFRLLFRPACCSGHRASYQSRAGAASGERWRRPCSTGASRSRSGTAGAGSRPPTERRWARGSRRTSRGSSRSWRGAALCWGSSGWRRCAVCWQDDHLEYVNSLARSLDPRRTIRSNVDHRDGSNSHMNCGLR